MKKIFKWFGKHKEGLLKSCYSLPIIFAIVISIFHCIKWFEIANPSSFAVALSVAIEVAAASTLLAILFSKTKFNVYLTFIVVCFVQILGNVFYSFNYIKETDVLFMTWVKFTDILFPNNEWNVDTNKFWLSILEGTIVPLLSLLSLDLISNFELKEEKKEKEEQVKVTTDVVQLPVVEDVVTGKIDTVVDQNLRTYDTNVINKAVDDFKRQYEAEAITQNIGELTHPEPEIIPEKVEVETTPEPVKEPEPVVEEVVEPVIETEIIPEPVKEPEPVVEVETNPEPVKEPEPVVEVETTPEPVKEPETVVEPVVEDVKETKKFEVNPTKQVKVIPTRSTKTTEQTTLPYNIEKPTVIKRSDGQPINPEREPSKFYYEDQGKPGFGEPPSRTRRIGRNTQVAPIKTK